MQVAAMFLHNMRTEPCPAWVFVGSNWTDSLKSKVDEIFRKHIEFEQFPSFNYWKVITDGADWVVAMRFTWDSGGIGGSMEKLESGLAEYYKNG